MASKTYGKSLRERVREGELSPVEALGVAPYALNDTIRKWFRAYEERVEGR